MLEEVYNAKLKLLNLNKQDVVNALLQDKVYSVTNNNDNSYLIKTTESLGNGNLFSDCEVIGNLLSNLLPNVVPLYMLVNILELPNNTYMVKL